MLKDAKVITSKFLQLKDEFDTNMRLSQTKVYADPNDTYAMVLTIRQALDQLYVLLHELTMEGRE